MALGVGIIPYFLDHSNESSLADNDTLRNRSQVYYIQGSAIHESSPTLASVYQPHTVDFSGLIHDADQLPHLSIQI